MITKGKSGPEIRALDTEGKWWGLAIDGLVVYAGRREECEARLAIIRHHQADIAATDHRARMLARACA